MYNSIEHALHVIMEYDAELRLGGEPDYPQWAFDLVEELKANNLNLKSE